MIVYLTFFSSLCDLLICSYVQHSRWYAYKFWCWIFGFILFALYFGMRPLVYLIQKFDRFTKTVLLWIPHCICHVYSTFYIFNIFHLFFFLAYAMVTALLTPSSHIASTAYSVATGWSFKRYFITPYHWIPCE